MLRAWWGHSSFWYQDCFRSRNGAKQQNPWFRTSGQDAIPNETETWWDCSTVERGIWQGWCTIFMVPRVKAKPGTIGVWTFSFWPLRVHIQRSATASRRFNWHSCRRWIMLWITTIPPKAFPTWGQVPFGSNVKEPRIHLHRTSNLSAEGPIYLGKSRTICKGYPPNNYPQRTKNGSSGCSDAVNEGERQSLRALVGSLQYAAMNTRPDLCSKLGWLQSQINKQVHGWHLHWSK